MRARSCLILLAMVAMAGAADNLLVNPELACAAGTINGWQGGEAGMTNVTEGLPEGVVGALQVTVGGSGSDGQVLQRLSIGDKGALWRVAAWTKASAGRTAYVQAKLIAADRTEVKRILIGEAGSGWQRLETVIDATGAASIDILLRWHRNDRTAGATAWFAAPLLAPATAAELQTVAAAPVTATAVEKPEGATTVPPLVLKAGVRTIVVVGDSTVQDYPKGDLRRGWGQLLPDFTAPGVVVVNRAAGGRSSKTFRAEGRWDPIIAAKPALILIQFGHNDSHAPGNPESTDARTDFRANMARYVDEAKAAGIAVALVTPPPRRLFRTDGSLTHELEPYAESIRAVAQAAGVPCIDLYAGGSDKLKALGQEAAIPLYCSEKDRSHFSERGAQMMARIVAGGMSGLDEPIRTLLRPQAQWPTGKEGA